MIFKKAIPAFYWPTKIVFIDDDYLSAMIISKLFRFNPTIIFSDPNEGIKYINENTICISDEDEFIYDLDESIEKNDFYAIKNLYKKIYKEKRFEEISTLIVDYDMPQCDGLSTIDKITNVSIKKILLTGVANEKIAVEAFNNGKINRYIKKLSENADLRLREYVHTLQMEYFIEKTQKLIERNEVLKSILENQYVMNFFTELISAKNIIEFYLVDEHGSFLTIDVNGHLYSLIIQSSEVLDGVIQLAAGMEGIKKNDATKLANKTKMLPYRALELIEQDKTLINSYLLDCKRIAETNLYYSLTSDMSFLKIEHGKLKFFNTP